MPHEDRGVFSTLPAAALGLSRVSTPLLVPESHSPKSCQDQYILITRRHTRSADEARPVLVENIKYRPDPIETILEIGRDWIETQKRSCYYAYAICKVRAAIL